MFVCFRIKIRHIAVKGAAQKRDCILLAAALDRKRAEGVLLCYNAGFSEHNFSHAFLLSSDSLFLFPLV